MKQTLYHLFHFNTMICKIREPMRNGSEYTNQISFSLAKWQKRFNSCRILTHERKVYRIRQHKIFLKFYILCLVEKKWGNKFKQILDLWPQCTWPEPRRHAVRGRVEPARWWFPTTTTTRRKSCILLTASINNHYWFVSHKIIIFFLNP